MPRFSRRSRRLAAVVALLVVPVACSDSGGDGDGGASGGRGERAEETYRFTVTAADVVAMAAEARPFPDDVKQAVLVTLDQYLRAAVVEPMRTGTAPSGLEHAFTGTAFGRITGPGPERASVVEEGTPVHGEVHQDRAQVALTALTGPAGEVVLVTARIDVGHTVDVDGTPVDVARTGELVIVSDVAGWRIDAFEVRAQRAAR